MPEEFRIGPVLIKSVGTNCVPRALALRCLVQKILILRSGVEFVLELAEHVQDFVNSFHDSLSPVVCETSKHYSDSVYDTVVLELLEVKSLVPLWESGNLWQQQMCLVQR
ncbi:hypothetical protein ElyMa_003865000 [Elysia marginata]|uniref:Uncharacterized protein n=1 Tax=Elysia marginata TaxID=1093978 RepID=A0AAV4FIT2_9GAST|nr:hypothetical protein ElyMa_003865000 [Elysia marginata]